MLLSGKALALFSIVGYNNDRGMNVEFGKGKAMGSHFPCPRITKSLKL